MSTETASRVEQIFTEANAYRWGHFLLKSGRHADRYIEKFQVLQWPERVTELCALLIERVHGEVGHERIDVVVGPTTGGVILAYEVARQLGVRGIFAEQMTSANGVTRRELRRGFRIDPSETVLLVDDVVTTGGSLTETLPVVEEAGAQLLMTAVIVDRSGAFTEVRSAATGRRFRATALWSLELPTYQPGAATCPGCAAGAELEARGSTGLSLPA